MSKIRINELARELEVKPSIIIDLLPELGVADKKTHSSSLDDDVVKAIRDRLAGTETEPFIFPEDDDGPGELDALARLPNRPPEPEQLDLDIAEPPAAEEPVAAAPAHPPAAVILTPPSPAPEAPAPSPAAAPAVPVAPATPAPSHAVAPAAPAPSHAAAPAAPATPAPGPAGEDRPKPVSPIRPPLAGRPIQPPVPGISRPPVAQAPPQPARTQAPPPPPPQVPAAAPGPPAPAPPPPPRPPLPPRTVVSGPLQPPPAGIPRPGQILSGPRQPIPSDPAPSAPGMPPPPPPRPPRPPAGMGAPGAPQGPRQGLAGQPAPRPVVPPNPAMVARLQQQTQQRPGPSQPAAPRPGAPQARPTSAAPGQPVYRGPVRPGQPVVRGPGMPGPAQPGGPGGARPPRRGMHPTTPLPPEPAVAPTDTRRHATKPGRNVARDKEIEEGKLLPMHGKHREEPVIAVNKEITIGEGITVKELAEKLGIKASLVIKKLVDKKIFATINQTLDVKLAEEIARTFGAASSRMSFEEEATWEVELAEDTAAQLVRAPVVTVMGHVDHGKTSLLDAIREADVAAHEHGGITQHIGAYQVVHGEKKTVFIDTPGHEAFTRMRARGAKVTDIVVLVVAADDGVMPQTVEAIDHAKAAKVPIIVAVNKIDKPDAQPERIKQQLADRGLLAEDWGGETIMVSVSAKTRQGIDSLLEYIQLVAEVQNLKANPTRPAICTVLEAKLDRGRGPVATILVRNGTLRVGDNFICGTVFGRIRALFSDRGDNLKEAEPSTPVEILGMESLPEVGETLQVVTDTGKAKQIVMFREHKAREVALAKSNRISLETLHAQLKEGEIKELNLILKADVGGSAEVLAESLQKLSNSEVRIKVIHSGVGAITETDVLLASASDAIVIGFNVRPERTAVQVAEQEKVDIRLHTIIYDLTQEIKKAMTGLLEPVFKEVYKGRAEVRDTFRITKVGTVAGCYILDGTITRGCEVRVLRDNIVIHTGKIEGLRRFKDDVSEVKSGFECGISLVNFSDVKPRDILEAFVTEKVAAELSS